LNSVDDPIVGIQSNTTSTGAPAPQNNEGTSEAEAAYREAVRVAPGDASAYHGLGNFLYDEHKYAEAEAVHREAVRLAPSVAAFYISHGNAVHALQRYHESEAAYREAVRLAPGYA
jgi:tetratricopeptide (TPR) repeat protein